MNLETSLKQKIILAEKLPLCWKDNLADCILKFYSGVQIIFFWKEKKNCAVKMFFLYHTKISFKILPRK